MALIDEVKARLPNQRLVELTNPNDTSITTVDDTLLTTVSTDVSSQVEYLLGEAFDLTDRPQLILAVEGVEIRLQWYKGDSNADTRYDNWMQRINALRMRRGNDRIRPKSTSRMDPAEEADNVRPFFDINSTTADIVPELADSSQTFNYGIKRNR